MGQESPYHHTSTLLWLLVTLLTHTCGGRHRYHPKASFVCTIITVLCFLDMMVGMSNLTTYYFLQPMMPPYGPPYAAIYSHGGVYAHPAVPIVSLLSCNLFLWFLSLFFPFFTGTYLCFLDNETGQGFVSFF